MQVSQIVKALAICNLISITLAVVGLRSIPLAGYELSPYPWWLFAPLAVGFTATVLLIYIAPRSSGRWLLPAIPLTIVALPLFRGYYYFGEGDPMYHLGALRDLLTGSSNWGGEFYPALHHMAGVTTLISGLSSRRTLLLVMVIAFGVWVISLPLVTRIVTDGGLSLGIIASAAFLPITPISTFPRPHPATAMIFITPIVLLTVFHRGFSRQQQLPLYGVLFAAAILYHPLIALILVGGLFFWANCDVLGMPSWFRTFLLTASFAALVTWLLQFSTFSAAFASSILSILEGSVGTDTASRTGSLRTLGISLPEYLIRVGMKYLFFGVLSGIAVFGALDRRDWKLVSFALGSIPVVLGAVVFLAAGRIGLWTRFFGFLMLIGTILAVQGTVDLKRLVRPYSQKVERGFPIIILGLAVAVALPTVLATPYALQPNDQVVESTYRGYESGFEYQDGVTPWYEARSPVQRYHSAIYGPEAESDVLLASGRSRYSMVPDHFNNQSMEPLGPSYLAVSAADYERDVRLYDGFRYNEDDFAYLDSGTCLNRVIDSGGFTLYRVC